MDEWTRYQEANYLFWKTLESSIWWSFDNGETGTFYVLARALTDPERFSILLTDLKSVWACEGTVATIQTLHADYNRGLETDTRGMALHIDKLIAECDPAANYEFAHGVWKAKTLLANVYRFQCQFMCVELQTGIARCVLNKYLIGALCTIVRTQEAIIDRQQALIRTFEGGKTRIDVDGDVRRLTQEIVKQRTSLGRHAKTVLSELLTTDIAAVEGRVQARENELKRKRMEEVQRQAEMAKKPKVGQHPPPAKTVAVYEEAPDEVARRQELDRKLQKPDVKKKPKKMDFL